MSPRAIPRVKDRVRGLRWEGLQTTVARCLELSTAEEVRAYLEATHPVEVSVG
jgi:phosphoenolpyruvate-protein kinase (PTS system EI component)